MIKHTSKKVSTNLTLKILKYSFAMRHKHTMESKTLKFILIKLKLFKNRSIHLILFDHKILKICIF